MLGEFRQLDGAGGFAVESGFGERVTLTDLTYAIHVPDLTAPEVSKATVAGVPMKVTIPITAQQTIFTGGNILEQTMATGTFTGLNHALGGKRVSGLYTISGCVKAWDTSERKPYSPQTVL